jgi:hypothetical protein
MRKFSSNAKTFVRLLGQTRASCQAKMDALALRHPSYEAREIFDHLAHLTRRRSKLPPQLAASLHTVLVAERLDSFANDFERSRVLPSFFECHGGEVDDPSARLLLRVFGDVVADKVWTNNQRVLCIFSLQQLIGIFRRQNKTSSDRNRSLKRLSAVR